MTATATNKAIIRATGGNTASYTAENGFGEMEAREDYSYRLTDVDKLRSKLFGILNDCSTESQTFYSVIESGEPIEGDSGR